MGEHNVCSVYPLVTNMYIPDQGICQYTFESFKYDPPLQGYTSPASIVNRAKRVLNDLKIPKFRSFGTFIFRTGRPFPGGQLQSAPAPVPQDRKIFFGNSESGGAEPAASPQCRLNDSGGRSGVRRSEKIAK